jgi:acyl-CoA reductase-like NAD-dependent aldehyde dehydrogenase
VSYPATLAGTDPEASLSESRGTIAIPEGPHELPASTPEEVDAAIAELRDRVKAWVDTPVEERVAMLRQAMRDTLDAAPGWALAGAVHKGIDRDSPHMGEEWIAGPYPTIRHLRLLAETLEDIATTGRPRPPEVRLRPDGQVAVDVFPTDWKDQLTLPGFHGEVRILPGVDRATVEDRMGRVYREGTEDEGGVALVLGAGNVSSIPPMDVLTKLLGENRVCLLKMNPVNEFVGPYLQAALQVFVDAGVLRLVYGGADVGAYCTQHEGIDEIHITGSDKTHDAIVYGTGEEGARRRAADEPVNTRPITSELGNVSPVIVVPGPWSARDLAYHGDHLASMLVQNAGFNCVAARVIVTHASWNRRNDLLDAVRDSLRRAEPRVPYYPGARDRWQRFVDAHPEAEAYGVAGPDQVPFTLIPDVDEHATEDIAFTTEAFCGVFSEVGLDAPRSVPEYLEQAVDFVNQTLWGTLSASILVHPESMKDPAIAAAVERAIDRLEYGLVVVNHWSALPYGTVSMPWGGYPGQPRHDIQSGTGVVHNTYMIEDVEKCVLRGPFRQPTKPLLFHTTRTLPRLGPLLCQWEATGGDLALLPRMLYHMLRA